MKHAIINYMLGGRLTFSLLILLLLVGYMSLLLGGTIESLARLLDITFGQGTLMENIIIWQIRAPRIVLAALTGFALGLAGAAIQGLLRNPLAEPALLGASNSAALGAVMIIYLGLSGTLSFAVPFAATLCALLSVGLLFLLVGQRADTVRLILAGFAVSAFSGAGIALALNLSPNFFAALEIAFW
ncbi:MAG: iron chelate uptake ABC transporter family permease subunit, partial [Alphaproteobacteria bacterium]|nr:iron chelate uptake ABC transporter family permease subunit [Alphaproteobacteria bacterium]